MGRFFAFWGHRLDIGHFGFQTIQPIHRSIQMKAHLNAYLWFIGFTLATKIIVAPIAKQMNIPFVQDL